MHPLQRALIAAVSMGWSLSAVVAEAAYSPAGSEFQVNSYTPGTQYRPVVAADAGGDLVVVWSSVGQDGSSAGLFGQRFASSGAQIGSEFQVNSYTPGNQRYPAVAADAGGDFVVVWESFEVFGQRFASSGARIGSEFQVNTYTLNIQRFADVAAQPGGDFVVVWMSNFQDGSFLGVFGQRFASSGARVGSEFQVNSYTPGNQRYPAVAADAGGDFVVVWERSTQDVFAQRFASNGSPSGTEFQVNSYTPGLQAFPDVSVGADGNFAVVWHSSVAQDGSGSAALGQRFDSNGAPSGTEFIVNSYTLGDQLKPAVAMDADGNFAVTWASGAQDGSSYGQFVQRYNSAGSADGSELQVNTFTLGQQIGYLAKNIAAAAGGDFAVVWRGNYQDGSVSGVLGQRFAVSLPTDTPTPTDTPVPPTPTPTDTPTATPIGACPLTVDGGCTTGFAKGTLLIKEDIAGKEKLVAKMVKGPALAQTALGNPLNGGGTVYSLCVYDDAGNLAGGIGGSVVVDRAGDTCGTLPCWKPVGADPPAGKGYKYKDTALASDGVLKLLYKGGDAGKSKAIVKGKGPNLPNGIPVPLQTTAFATVQLRSSDGICLSVVVDDIKKHGAAFFKAKFAAP